MFHQVIANLRRRDWTTVAIDLLVVVVGVFIGVQASNWNAERETNLKAVDFSERLKSDLREEAWGYDLQISYYGEVLDNARRAADALSGRASLSDEADVPDRASHASRMTDCPFVATARLRFSARSYDAQRVAVLP